MKRERVAMIEQRLTDMLSPESLEVIDESHLHAGHEGAKSGGGHFAVTIVSNEFAGKSAIERHRMVYGAMGDAMNTEIHALSINAFSPEEI